MALRIGEAAVDDPGRSEPRTVRATRQVVDGVFRVGVPGLQEDGDVVDVVGAVGRFDSLGRKRHHQDAGRYVRHVEVAACYRPARTKHRECVDIQNGR